MSYTIYGGGKKKGRANDPALNCSFSICRSYHRCTSSICFSLFRPPPGFSCRVYQDEKARGGTSLEIFLLFQGDGKPETTPFAGLALYTDLTAHQLD